MQAQEAEKFFTSLCTPSHKAQAAGKHFSFLFRFVHKFVHNVLLLVLVHLLVAQDVRLDLCLVSFKVIVFRMLQDAAARRGLQQNSITTNVVK